MEVDVGQSDSVRNLFSTVQRLYRSSPSVVINSAGCLTHGFLLTSEERAFDEMVRVNLKVCYYLYFFLRHLSYVKFCMI